MRYKSPIKGLSITYRWNNLGKVIEMNGLDVVLKDHLDRTEDTIRWFWRNYKKYGKKYSEYKR